MKTNVFFKVIFGLAFSISINIAVVKESKLSFINTSFENASPLYWEIDEDGAIQVFLVYDSERNSTNRANGHWHFQLQAEPGAEFTLILNNFDNVWNGKKGVPV